MLIKCFYLLQYKRFIYNMQTQNHIQNQKQINKQKGQQRIYCKIKGPINSKTQKKKEPQDLKSFLVNQQKHQISIDKLPLLKNVSKKKNNNIESHSPTKISLYPAFNRTHICVENQTHNYCITHFDINGNILNKLIYKKDQKSQYCQIQVEMLADQELIILQQLLTNSKKETTIKIWNLKTNQTVSYLHSIIPYKSLKSQLFTFPTTNYICICETISQMLVIYSFEDKAHMPKNFKLSYYQYHYNNQRQKHEIILKHTFQQEIDMQGISKIVKINNQSKIGILPKQLDFGRLNDFMIYEFKDNLNRKKQQGLQKMRFSQNIRLKFLNKNMQISQIYQISFNTFYIKLQIQQLFFNRDMVPQQYLWNFIQNTQIQLSLNIPDKYYQVQFGSCLRKISNIQKVIQQSSPTNYINCRKYLQGPINTMLRIKVPIYLIYLQNEQVKMGKKLTQIEQFNHQHQFISYPSFMSNKIVKYQIQFNELIIKQLFVKESLVNLSEIAIFYMLQIMKDCDQDLLYQISRILRL